MQVIINRDVPQTFKQLSTGHLFMFIFGGATYMKLSNDLEYISFHNDHMVHYTIDNPDHNIIYIGKLDIS
jgi:hypothetical protein